MRLCTAFSDAMQELFLGHVMAIGRGLHVDDHAAKVKSQTLDPKPKPRCQGPARVSVLVSVVLLVCDPVVVIVYEGLILSACWCLL